MNKIKFQAVCAFLTKCCKSEIPEKIMQLNLREKFNYQKQFGLQKNVSGFKFRELCSGNK